ncbi:AraC family transcriptional regulator ligand-binding domain-containing protein [Xylophilus sp. GW821-FHT01B05]
MADLPAVLARALVAGMRLRGQDPEPLCRGLGFGLDDLDLVEFRISYAQSVRMARRALARLNEPGLGLQLGSGLNVVSWGLAALGMMACDTLHEMLEFAVDAQHAMGSLLELRTERSARWFSMLAHVRPGDPDVTPFLVDTAFAAMLRACRVLVQPEINPLSVDLAIEKPAHYAQYEEVFRCPVQFGQPANRMAFALHAVPVPTADRRTRAAVQALMAQEEIHSGAYTLDLTASVVRAIRHNLARPPGLKAIAAELHLSERTLRRRLAEAGHSYAGLLAEERRQRALSRLARPRHSLAEIAAEVGFSDPRSLRRAVQRWTGGTPGAWRAKAGSGWNLSL